METPNVMGVDSARGKAGRADPVKAKLRHSSRRTPFSPAPIAELRAGQRVSIESGPLRGLQGVVQRIEDGRRIVVSVSLAVNSVSVELDSNWVKSSG